MRWARKKNKFKGIFGVSNIYNDRKDFISYPVASLKELEIRISHLQIYKLQTQKRADFLLSKQIIYLMNNNNS